jgi:predicted permease
MPGSILKAIFPVIAYLCIGYIAKRTKKFDPSNSGILIGYVLNISIPCMIVLDMTRQDMFKDLSKYIEFFGGYLLVSFIVFVIAYSYARIVKRQNLLIGSYFSAAASYSNTCMIALPILAIMLPVGGATYGVIGVIVLIIGLQTTSIIYEYTSEENSKLNFRKILISIGKAMRANYFIAMVLGLILSFLGFQFPSVLGTSLNAVGITTAPVALFAIGAQLNFTLFKNHIRIVSECTFFKLFLMPVIAWMICDLVKLPPAPSVAVILCSAVPTAKCQYAVARSHDVYVEETESIVAGTTILSMVTLAVVIAMLAKEYPTLVT